VLGFVSKIIIGDDMGQTQRMIRPEKLDVRGDTFGLTFDNDDEITLWIEDDELWYSVATFHQTFLSDLQSTSWEGLRAWARRKVTERKQS
jgi:antibiotic biosynthesis monooxygenase (ABM) superfamily enzyme